MVCYKILLFTSFFTELSANDKQAIHKTTEQTPFPEEDHEMQSRAP